MSAPILPEGWAGTLDDLTRLANDLLPLYLPIDRKPRTQDDINPRLIRHYTTQGLIDPPAREGREARYRRRHLLQLLTLRRLMAEGHSAQALQSLLEHQSDAQLEALLLGQSRLQVQSQIPSPIHSEVAASQDLPASGNPALDFLEGLKRAEGTPRGAVSARQRAAAASPVMPPATSAPGATPGPSAAQYSRLTVAPGLELHVNRDFRLPKTLAEQDALARQVIAALTSLRRLP